MDTDLVEDGEDADEGEGVLEGVEAGGEGIEGGGEDDFGNYNSEKAEKAAFKSKFLAALESSLHLDTELYDKLILKRGVKDNSDVGPKLETVSIAMMPVSRQNSYSSRN